MLSASSSILDQLTSILQLTILINRKILVNRKGDFNGDLLRKVMEPILLFTHDADAFGAWIEADERKEFVVAKAYLGPT